MCKNRMQEVRHLEEAMYTVGRLAEICGTTVRTLQHYDKIGLLVATRSGDKNSRYYTEHDLVKLQQILFYKNLGFTLKEIQDQCLALGAKGDLKQILQRQSDVLFKKEMEFRSDRAYIDAMVASLETNHPMNLETMLGLTVNRRKHILLDYQDMSLPPQAAQAFEEFFPDLETALQVYWKWKELVLEAFLLTNNGIDPGSEAGYVFGEKWHCFGSKCYAGQRGDLRRLSGRLCIKANLAAGGPFSHGTLRFFY
ncbi:MerR family transcriptional regulator [Paenibacillus sp. GM2FR]|uniref:MerR family transcriptional regulator n=1 Tax=unclassified Paenibacillus TaxID=185978 RepID=UPI000C27F13E|nr:MerR family transcriptional regulator [Paenibacillus sp. GM2FR]